MKLKLTLLLLGISCSVFGQSQTVGTASATLDVTNIKPTILTGGDMFHVGSSVTSNFNPGFEVPRGSGKHSFISGALWIGGHDAQNYLYLSAQTYRQSNQVGFWPGPVGTNHDPAHSTAYDKIWKVKKVQIQYHIQNFNTPGYSPPTDIATWPGNGNTANGEAAQLAPFVDVNNDGIYSPGQGDYPDIKGDQALYQILNDKGNVKAPYTYPLGYEVHVMHYGFDDATNRPIFNTLFSQYRIVNRGQVSLQDFYAGIWADFDLGNWDDDYVGCDTTTNRFFVYNGDNNDEDKTYTNAQGIQTTAFGYGLNPPVQSVQFLDQTLSKFIYYNNSNNPTNGNPSSGVEYYNYLRAIWRDGKPVTYGYDGTNQARPYTSHMFPGTPGSTGWTESNPVPGSATSTPNTPGDRRGLGSIGPFILNPGQELKFTVAYTFSKDPNATNNIPVAAQDAVAVQNFFNNNLLASSKPIQVKETLKLYPNPASDLLQIQLPNQFANKAAKVVITDNLGRNVLAAKVRQGESTVHLNIASLSKGIYQVSVTSENHTATGRLVKQ
ncbi:T9SS type A sorting domain-containing protein [Adhaeribacter soli]|uniref:T9SS type A sorting domain-containing protein n=1 Tax=Adhaeribacter soli TaxID=2607655 RepID=A0A5N1IS73_9BACT|nr:T9SS type A sorting domain-containing protein [Adhaeribacter soli]KAA9327359.1 T9SS type A sorting domain-containing protein [Adhaeribacter soli]